MVEVARLLTLAQDRRSAGQTAVEDEIVPEMVAAADALTAEDSSTDAVASWFEAFALVAGAADEELADAASGLLDVHRKAVSGDRLSPFARRQLGALLEGWDPAADPIPAPPVAKSFDAFVDDAAVRLRFQGISKFTSPRGFPVVRGRMQITDGGQTLGDFLVNTGGGASSFMKTNGPLPPGRYWASNYRARDKKGFVLNGVGFSLDLDPTPDTPVYGRSLFRIHPDGLSEGTNGCLGLRESADDLKRAAALLEAAVRAGPALVTVDLG